MGLAIAIFVSMLVCILALTTNRLLVPYALTFAWICFIELGYKGSDAGSFMFDQQFIHFYNFKFIEILTVILYGFTLVTARSKNPPIFRYEKILLFFFLAWTATILLIEYLGHNTISTGGWRYLMVGILFFHMLTIYLDTEEKILSFVKFMLVVMSIRALIFLIAYWTGYGMHGPRGYVPISSDTRQVELFTYGIMLLTAYLANYSVLPMRSRLFPMWLASIMLATCSLLVLLCTRRTQWMIGITGVIIVLYIYKKLKIQHVTALVISVAVAIVLLISVPGLEDFRDRQGDLFASMNLFNEKTSQEQKNLVHIKSVSDYISIVLSSPEILRFGYRGRSGAGYGDFSDEGSGFGLGSAHNSILTTILVFGIPGLILFILFYINIFKRYKMAARIPMEQPARFIAVSSLVFLCIMALPTIIFSSPFYGQIKAVLYVFTALFLMRATTFYASDKK